MNWRKIIFISVLATLSACQSAPQREPTAVANDEGSGDWQSVTTSDPSTFRDTMEDSRLAVEDGQNKNKVMRDCNAVWFIQKGRRLDRDLLWIRARSLADSEFDQIYSRRLSKGTRDCIRAARN